MESVADYYARQGQESQNSPEVRAAHTAYMRTYRAKNREKLNEQLREQRARNPEIHRASSREVTARLRAEVLAGYGHSCACCGETEDVFLALDHVNGGGCEERRRTGQNSNGVYRRARREGFPPDLQLLCHNCNFAKHKLGACPHKKDS